jgi:hypothetical protein
MSMPSSCSASRDLGVTKTSTGKSAEAALSVISGTITRDVSPWKTSPETGVVSGRTGETGGLTSRKYLIEAAINRHNNNTTAETAAIVFNFPIVGISLKIRVTPLYTIVKK